VLLAQVVLLPKMSLRMLLLLVIPRGSNITGAGINPRGDGLSGVRQHSLFFSIEMKLLALARIFFV
jgi:hypothetical protein